MDKSNINIHYKEWNDTHFNTLQWRKYSIITREGMKQTLELRHVHMAVVTLKTMNTLLGNLGMAYVPGS